MKLHELQPAAGAKRAPKRVGRGTGSGHGKTAGRGSKGQLSRSGGGKGPGFEGGQTPLYRQLPKRGFTNKYKVEYAVVNVSDLERVFEAGDEVDRDALREKGLVKGHDALVKVLGDGELTKSLTVRADKFSESAMSKIKAAGGSAEVV
ncbi:MAG: 50S ribosomal protein L15 [Bacillota bacterium]|jgi:large subunit ribosomal protein L15|nr:50S ribosomal protein L15 [Bacillota bacterium]HHY61590.1 50S ribosomal protein L15 [Bacillota bacterium]HOB42386.1 50S ribosomal protein L15 [Bacillota bacterium]HOK69995.1 50S ribosomal protein L15 [Bacillota bacterium]HOO30377.1 50S ribosomal protein L15 [Bacillota bacterium]